MCGIYSIRYANEVEIRDQVLISTLGQVVPGDVIKVNTVMLQGEQFLHKLIS